MRVFGGLFIEGEKWIQKAIKRPGSLRRWAGVSPTGDMPERLKRRIAGAEPGTKIKVGGEKKTVTPRIKKKAVLAKTLSRLGK